MVLDENHSVKDISIGKMQLNPLVFDEDSCPSL